MPTTNLYFKLRCMIISFIGEAYPSIITLVEQGVTHLESLLDEVIG